MIKTIKKHKIKCARNVFCKDENISYDTSGPNSQFKVLWKIQFKCNSKFITYGFYKYIQYIHDTQ